MHEGANIPMNIHRIFHFMEKANGINKLYASLDRYPDVCVVVTLC